MKRWHEYAAVLGLLLASTTFASAAPRQPVDDGWLAWQGCWHAFGDPQDNLLCIVVDGDAARLINVVAGKMQDETRIIADGRSRPISLEGCSGTEKAIWSKDGQRLFLGSDMACGEHTHRKVTGIMAMHSVNEWMNVQAVNTGGVVVARTRRYTAVEATNIPDFISTALRANRLARETSRYAASAELDLSDVVEATKAVDAQVVSEWLVAMDQRFELTGAKLVQLARDGVSADVIDVLVAVSNPQHFAVKETKERPAYVDRQPGRGGYDPCYGYNPLYSGYGYGGYGYYGYASSYSPYSPGCYYPSPWGYDPWGWSRGTIVVVRDNGGDNGGSGRAGKVTRRGYSGGSGSSTAKPRDDNSSRPASTSTATTSTASSRPATTTTTNAGSASPGGYSSGSGSGGGGGSNTGRTAHPRDKD